MRKTAIKIDLGDRLTIADVHDRQKDWNEFMARNEAVSVDAGKVTAIDTPGLQLLLSLKRSVVSRGRTFTWTKVSDEARNVARLVDLESALEFDNE